MFDVASTKKTGAKYSKYELFDFKKEALLGRSIWAEAVAHVVACTLDIALGTKFITDISVRSPRIYVFPTMLSTTFVVASMKKLKK